MADDQPRRDELAQLRSHLAAQDARLVAQDARLAAQQVEFAAFRARMERPRRRLPWRVLPLALAALLVALIPLATLAANPFSDLTGGVHDANIDAIYTAGITTGFADPANPGRRLYKPANNVTREEMASFLARTAGLGGNPPVANAKTAVSAQTATNATNASHATSADTATHAGSADTATNATSATNAVQLNGQAASFYQPAGQPIAHATNADHATAADNATNATSATNAGNAAQLNGQPASYYQPAGQPIANAAHATNADTATTVGGYNASALNRVASSTILLTTTIPNTLQFTEILRVTLTIPGSASQMVTVRGVANPFGPTTGGSLATYLFIDGGNQLSSPLYTPYQTTGANIPVPICAEWTFVASPGAHTFSMVVDVSGTASPLSLTSQDANILTATTHPFGTVNSLTVP